MLPDSSIIKINLQRLLKEGNWKVIDLENKARTEKVVHDIISVSTAYPGVDILKAFVEALNVGLEKFSYDYDKEGNVNFYLLSLSTRHIKISIN